MTDELERISAYLSGGGMFNPELANHDAVRELVIDCRDRIMMLEEQLDAFNMDGSHAAFRITQLENCFDNIEEYLKGLVSVHSRFAHYSKGDFNGKKERIRAAEAARLLAYIQKKRNVMNESN